MPLKLYPEWVRADPTFALELLAQIRWRCSKGESLDDEERAYLADAIGKILNGVAPDRAFFLVATVGRKKVIFGRRNVEIYNKVQAKIQAGKSKRAAYRIVSVGTNNAAKKSDADQEALTDKAIEAICRKIEAVLKVPKQIGGRK